MFSTARHLGIIVLLLVSAARGAAAQGGRLVGVVTADSGGPVGGVTISAVKLGRHAVTDDSGVFVFTGLPMGRHALSFRRLGYEPQDVSVSVSWVLDSLHVRMISHAHELAGVAVGASTARQRHNIQAFYERVERGIGTYVTRADILARKPTSTTDMVRTAPGIRVTSSRGGDGVRFTTSALFRSECIPTMWLDGQRAPGMELGDVPVSDVEGIELYNGPSTTPLQFSQGPTSPACGVVVVWTRPTRQP